MPATIQLPDWTGLECTVAPIILTQGHGWEPLIRQVLLQIWLLTLSRKTGLRAGKVGTTSTSRVKDLRLDIQYHKRRLMGGEGMLITQNKKVKTKQAKNTWGQDPTIYIFNFLFLYFMCTGVFPSKHVPVPHPCSVCIWFHGTVIIEDDKPPCHVGARNGDQLLGKSSQSS